MNLPRHIHGHVPPAPSNDVELDEGSHARSGLHSGAKFDGVGTNIASSPRIDGILKPSMRYSDQPMTWSTRLFGIGGVTAITLIILGGAIFTWRVYTAPPAAPKLSVFDVASPAAAPEPPREIPPEPKKQENPLPTPVRSKVEPPKVQLSSVNPLPPPEVQPVSNPIEHVERAAAPERPPVPPASQRSNAKPTWEGMVLAALNKARRYPREAQRARQQGVPYIRFVMDREGRVQSVRLERSSGVTALDDEAVKLPKRAAPLPKPPEGVGAETIELVVPVEFFLR